MIIIISPLYAPNSLLVNVPAVTIYTINNTFPLPPAFFNKYPTPPTYIVSETHIVRCSLAILSTVVTSVFILRNMYVQYPFPLAVSITTEFAICATTPNAS
jgi:hypothetical protein